MLHLFKVVKKHNKILMLFRYGGQRNRSGKYPWTSWNKRNLYIVKKCIHNHIHINIYLHVMYTFEEFLTCTFPQPWVFYTSPDLSISSRPRKMKQWKKKTSDFGDDVFWYYIWWMVARCSKSKYLKVKSIEIPWSKYWQNKIKCRMS